MEIIQEYWQGIIALFALIVAGISTFVAFLTFRLQRIHNIKSITPILQIGQWDYENNLCIDLRNSGLGPAMVKSVRVLNHTEEEKRSIYAWLPSKLPGQMNYKEYWTGYKNFVVKPDQCIALVEIPIDTTQSDQVQERERIRSILRQLTVHIEYQDIYENKMEPKKMHLYVFARTDNVN